MSLLYGLLGEKLGHSLSPKIHSIIFEKLKIDGYYHIFEVEKHRLQTAIEGFKALGIKGINVTIPYKIDVQQYIDEISKEALKIGSINTICFNNKSTAYNTDYYGFGKMLDKYNINISDKKAVILGSGGAARAVIQYLCDNNIDAITIVTRDCTQMEKHVKFKQYNIINYNHLDTLPKTDIVINCTPCGMHPDVNSSPVTKKILSKFDTAIDLIYNPFETLFLKYAKELQIRAVNGLYMLVAQAVAAQELWHNIKINNATTDEIYTILSSKL